MDTDYLTKDGARRFAIRPAYWHSWRRALCLACLCLAFAGAGGLSAQTTAVELETLLAQAEVTHGQAARFALDAAGLAAFAGPEQAFQYAAGRGWMPRGSASASPIRLDSVSLLLMRAFDLPGGIMYRITGSAHFAYRELEHRGFIHERNNPNEVVSGDTLLYLVSRILAHTGESYAVEAEMLQAYVAAAIGIQLEMYADVHVAVVEGGIMITLSDVQFLADSAEIPSAERDKIAEIAGILRDIPGSLLVAGHTAMAGTPEGRLAMSTERAQAVAELLVQLGARDAGQITTVGYGGEVPVASNATAQGMAANRRVEIIVLEGQP